MTFSFLSEFKSQQASFLSHPHHLLHIVGRRRAQFRFGFGNEFQGFRGAGGHTEPAPDAAVCIDNGQAVGIQAEGLHLTPFQAGFTTGAVFHFDNGKIVGKDHFRRFGVLVQRPEYTAAVAAAIAHAGRIL